MQEGRGRRGERGSRKRWGGRKGGGRSGKGDLSQEKKHLPCCQACPSFKRPTCRARSPPFGVPGAPGVSDPAWYLCGPETLTAGQDSGSAAGSCPRMGVPSRRHSGDSGLHQRRSSLGLVRWPRPRWKISLRGREAPLWGDREPHTPQRAQSSCTKASRFALVSSPWSVTAQRPSGPERHPCNVCLSGAGIPGAQGAGCKRGSPKDMRTDPPGTFHISPPWTGVAPGGPALRPLSGHHPAPVSRGFQSPWGGH